MLRSIALLAALTACTTDSTGDALQSLPVDAAPPALFELASLTESGTRAPEPVYRGETIRFRVTAPDGASVTMGMSDGQIEDDATCLPALQPIAPDCLDFNGRPRLVGRPRIAQGGSVIFRLTFPEGHLTDHASFQAVIQNGDEMTLSNVIYRPVLSYEDCANGIDDDADGMTDCFDLDCISLAECIDPDCAGMPGGQATLDECGTCDDDPTNDCVQDCAGDWGGLATVDACGTCDDDPANDCVQDCAGDWGGLATLDQCGTCDDDPANDCVQDCDGLWGGFASLDACGTCDDDPFNDCSDMCDEHTPAPAAAGDQAKLVLTKNASGDRIAAVWRESGAVQAQIYDGAGATLGDVIELTDTSTNNQVAATFTEADDLLVGWYSSGTYYQFQAISTTQSPTSWVNRIAEHEALFSTPQQLNASGGSSLVFAARPETTAFVSMYETYESGAYNVYRNHINSAPTYRHGSARRVNNRACENVYQLRPSVNYLPSGGVVRAWIALGDPMACTSSVPVGSRTHIYAECESGTVDQGQIPDHLIADFSGSSFAAPRVVALGDDGDFLIYWQQGDQVHARFGSCSGTGSMNLDAAPAAPLIGVTGVTSQGAPHAIPHGEDGFLLAYASTRADAGDTDVFVQTFDRSAQPTSAASRITPDIAGNQTHPTLLPSDSSPLGFTLGWLSDHTGTTGVHLAAFGSDACSPATCLTTDCAPETDICDESSDNPLGACNP